MEKILLFFATLFVIPIILTLLYNGYIKFLLWRCKLIYDEKAGYWVLPFWAWMIGLIQSIPEIYNSKNVDPLSIRR